MHNSVNTIDLSTFLKMVKTVNSMYEYFATIKKKFKDYETHESILVHMTTKYHEMLAR